MMTNLDSLRYPIGEARREDPLTPSRRDDLIGEIAALPALLRDVLANFDDTMLETPYRPGGWTARQVVHHMADSHLNAYVRIRLALTEPRPPTILPYDEARWAELPDVASTRPAVSVDLLEALHARWVALLRGLPPEAFAREVVHPQHGRSMSIDELIVSYAWHGRHHLAHLEIISR
jgi:hypothetical protein